VTTWVVQNKTDLCEMAANSEETVLRISAKTGAGLSQLRTQLHRFAGLSNVGESRYSARTRHVDALLRSLALLQQTQTQFQATGAGELLAEDLKLAQQILGEITGQISSDELLGKIFGSFCVGK
jgi:tRNA modification GTPase